MNIMNAIVIANAVNQFALGVVTAGMQMWQKFTASQWTGGNRLPDSSPVGTNSAAPFTGRALSFDGVNDWVDCGNPNITCRSVVLYINPSVSTDDIMRLTSTINLRLVSGTLTAGGWTSPTRYVNGATGTSISTNTWQQIAITSATSFTVNDLEIGRVSATEWYAGLISNVKIFSVELTAAQVAELYANPEQVLPTGVTDGQLVGWWPLADGVSALISFDGSGSNNHGVISGATGLFSVAECIPQWGVIGNNFPMFFGNNQVAFGSSNTLNINGNKLTIYHKYIKTGLDSDDIIFVRGSQGLNSGYITRANNGTFTFQTYGTTNNDLVSPAGSAPIYRVLNIVATYDGSTKKIYINNVLSASVACTGNIGSLLDAGAVLGLTSFDGIIFETGIWDKDLTESQINDINNGVDFTNIETSNIKGAWRNISDRTSDWVDLSGNGNNGTVSISLGRVFLPQGKLSNNDIIGVGLVNKNYGSFIGDGVGYSIINDATSLDITTTITLEAWVRPFTVSTTQTIIGKNSAYALNITSGAKLQFQRWSSTTSGTVASSASLVANAWRHVVVTYNGSTTSIYINGVLDSSSGALTGAIDQTSTNVLLGALTTTTQKFSGYIDSVKVYNRALAADEILQNYNAEKNNYL